MQDRSDPSRAACLDDTGQMCNLHETKHCNFSSVTNAKSDSKKMIRHAYLLESFSVRLGMSSHEVSTKYALKAILHPSRHLQEQGTVLLLRSDRERKRYSFCRQGTKVHRKVAICRYGYQCRPTCIKLNLAQCVCL